MKSAGLVDGHAYTLIGAFDIKHKGKQTKLLKIRNPWGRKEWTGDWSDSWPGWTKATKEKVGWTEKKNSGDGDNNNEENDGIFFISFADYLLFFYITTICF